MNRLLTAMLVAGLALVGGASTAGAANQPSQGERSIGRNESGSAGVHCHVLTASHTGELTIRVFPSHKGHLNAGGDIFSGDLNCDGIAG
jgi:hypothetical protein